jgi:hypothetical protein
MKELTIEQIAKWNDQLAQFMGITWWDLHKQKHSENPLIASESLHYHQDWSWLMPVIVKIEELGFIFSNDLANTTVLANKAFASAFIQVFGSPSGISKMESMYRAVGEFIDWYNNKK